MRRLICYGLAAVGVCTAAVADVIFPDRDTRLNDEPFTNNNYGASTTFASSDRSRMLLHFEVSEVAAEIISASLRLYRTGGSPTEARTLSVYELLAANDGWIEGTSSGYADPGEPTWGHQAFQGQYWAGSPGAGTPGTDYNATLLGSLSSSATSGWWVITLTASVVENWRVNSNQNYGVLVFDNGEAGSMFFASRENASPEFRPQLQYELIPEPASAALFALACAAAAALRRRSKRPAPPPA